MEGISRSAGVGPMVTLGGRKLSINAKILRHYALIEAEIIAARGNPFDLIRQLGDAMPDRDDLARAVVSRAFVEAKSWRMVSIDEMFDWLDNTTAGRCFRTWLAVKDNDPTSLTLEAVSGMYLDEWERIALSEGPAAAEQWDTMISRGIDTAEGRDELGNSNTSPATGVAAEATAPSPGTASTASSPTSEAGNPSGSIA